MKTPDTPLQLVSWHGEKKKKNIIKKKGKKIKTRKLDEMKYAKQYCQMNMTSHE